MYKIVIVPLQTVANLKHVKHVRSASLVKDVKPQSVNQTALVNPVRVVNPVRYVKNVRNVKVAFVHKEEQ